MEIREYGKMPDGTPVYQYTLDNGKGLKAKILNYGGIITNLTVRDQDDVDTDVVLGLDSLEDYWENGDCFGAAIGRNSNRILNARFELNGKEYVLNKNDGENNLHGGNVGFNQKVWQAEPAGTEQEPALVLRLTSPDMEEGFPGTVQVKMTYTLTKNNGLHIHYEAETDKDTIVNLTNHSYFNLKGHQKGPVYDQILQINSGFYTPNTEKCIPNGEILSVTGTPFDFRAPKPVGQDISADFEQIALFGGYDHNFALAGRGFRKAAMLYCPDNGICMEVYTDKPGMQLYTGNMIAEGRICKDGTAYGKHWAVCLETQFFPNAMEFSHFPSPVLKAGAAYDYTTEYRFSIK